MKKNTPLPKILGYLLIGCFGALLVIAFRPNFAKLYELKTHLSRLTQKLILEEKKNYFLKNEFNGLSNDAEYTERVAREKLGWCRPTETVYRFQTRTPGLSGASSDSNRDD